MYIIPMLAILCAPLIGQPTQPSFAPTQVKISQTVLTQVNSHPITSADLTKKMDLLLYKQFPQQADLAAFRYQFYLANWKDVLKNLIDQELILADAHDKDIKISDGEIKQELDEMFGPNVVLTLDKLKLRYEEAFETVRKDILMRRMMMFKVHIKAHQAVSPKKVKDLYQAYLTNFVSDPVWTYKVITIKSDSPEEILNELKNSDPTLEKLACIENITYGETFTQVSSKLSSKYLATLESLKENTFSEPIETFSNSNEERYWRVFYLYKLDIPQPLTFESLSENLKSRLLQENVEQQINIYLEKLHQEYGVYPDKIIREVEKKPQLFNLS